MKKNIIPKSFLFIILILPNILTAKTIIQWVAAAKNGEKNLAGADFTGSDLSGLDLSKANLQNANLTGVNLTGANLSAADLYNANFMGVNFTGANLTKATFLNTNMQYVNFRNANLQQTLLQEVNLQYAILNGANLTSANLVLADLRYTDLQNANLTNTLFDYATIQNPESKTIYTNNKAAETAKKQLLKINLSVPEVVETEAVGAAMEQYNTTKKSTLKLTGAKINNNTKGIDLVWAKKNGIVVVAPKTNTATATTKKK